ILSHPRHCPRLTMAVPFRDRTEAGHLLATRLLRYANRPDVQVLALPRGGVPVTLEVAKTLNAPLDVFIVRKLGVPGHEELAMGAAVAALRKLHPSKIIVAVPTAAPSTCDEFKTEVDEIVCAETPQPFYAVGAWYDDFTQITDDQVREMLEQPAHHAT